MCVCVCLSVCLFVCLSLLLTSSGQQGWAPSSIVKMLGPESSVKPFPLSPTGKSDLSKFAVHLLQASESLNPPSSQDRLRCQPVGSSYFAAALSCFANVLCGVILGLTWTLYLPCGGTSWPIMHRPGHQVFA